MILVFGAGISGNGISELLKSKGKEVLIIDDKIGDLKTEDGIKLILENKIEYIVKSPGIPFEVPFLKKARELNIEIYSEIDIAYEYMDKNIEIIAFTGTNGKTTTSTKMYELLKKAGFNVDLGGNVGKSFAMIVKENKKLDYIVLELSSYQLENNPKIKPKISGIINLTPDHLSRYKDEEDYYLTKFNIFRNKDTKDYMIVNSDDSNVLSIAKKAKEEIKNYINPKRVYVSKKEKGSVFVNENKIYIMKNITDIFSPKFNIDNQADYLMDVSELSLKGKHNLENILFIIATAKICEIPIKVIRNFLKETKPIEHRMELFFEKANLLFVNDSKGTNIDSTIKAIESYEDNLILICGGEDKKLPLDALVNEIKENVSYVYLYGENRFLMKEKLDEIKYYKYEIYENVEKVIESISKKEFIEKTVVLFSPATSSFDQFLNFEDRGRYFKSKVLEIIGENK